jgi:hypothetical protein
MEDSDTEVLDISWIEEHEKEMEIDKNYNKECMNYILTKYIYININDEIENVCSDKIPIDNTINNIPIIKNENVLEIVQKKRNISTEKKYKLIDILLYNVDLEPEKIQNYANSDSFSELSKSFLKIHDIFNDIEVDSSIFIFHKINTLYFIFKEIENKYGKYEKQSNNLTSILKNKTNKNEMHINKKNMTKKKVYFKEVDIENKNIVIPNITDNKRTKKNVEENNKSRTKKNTIEKDE